MSSKRTDIKFHRDGSITVWDVYAQGWTRVRAARVGDAMLSTLSDYERTRIARHAARFASEVL
jgi:hypothetical protein